VPFPAHYLVTKIMDFDWPQPVLCHLFGVHFEHFLIPTWTSSWKRTMVSSNNYCIEHSIMPVYIYCTVPRAHPRCLLGTKTRLSRVVPN
jgi:hypothetical protein